MLETNPSDVMAASIALPVVHEQPHSLPDDPVEAAQTIAARRQFQLQAILALRTGAVRRYDLIRSFPISDPNLLTVEQAQTASEKLRSMIGTSPAYPNWEKKSKMYMQWWRTAMVTSGEDIFSDLVVDMDEFVENDVSSSVIEEEAENLEESGSASPDLSSATSPPARAGRIMRRLGVRIRPRSRSSSSN